MGEIVSMSTHCIQNIDPQKSAGDFLICVVKGTGLVLTQTAVMLKIC
jgi:hypothetical protein